MPIRRPRGPKPALRHLAFLQTMSEAPEASPEHVEARATFLALRHLDHWIALGADGGAPTERSTTATQEALAALGGDAELRAALTSVVAAIPELSDADAQPVLPRVFALGSLLEQRGRTRQAADVYSTVARHVDAAAHADLAYDASMRMASCLRNEGQLDQADQAYATAGTLAARIRDREKVMTSRVGRAKIMAARGNIPAAAAALTTLETEARATGARDLVALILHERAGLAHATGDFPGALRLIWSAYHDSTDEYDRERMMWDLATLLGRIGAEDAARDALQLIALSARQKSARLLAQQNLMDLARRTGNEIAFHQRRKELAEAPMPAPRRVSYLLDAGKGLAEFGDRAQARTLLTEALALAESVGLNQRIFQIEAALAEIDRAATTPPSRTTAPVVRTFEPPDEIRSGLRALLREAALASA